MATRPSILTIGAGDGSDPDARLVHPLLTVLGLQRVDADEASHDPKVKLTDGALVGTAAAPEVLHIMNDGGQV